MNRDNLPSRRFKTDASGVPYVDDPGTEARIYTVNERTKGTEIPSFPELDRRRRARLAAGGAPRRSAIREQLGFIFLAFPGLILMLTVLAYFGVAWVAANVLAMADVFLGAWRGLPP